MHFKHNQSFKLIPSLSSLIILITFILLHVNSVGYSKTVQPFNKIIFNIQQQDPLYKIALQLSKDNLQYAHNHHDIPLVLAGTANLSHNSTIVLFTQLQSSSLCGSSGCSTNAYLKKGNEWQQILESVTGEILIKKTSHKGMYDLLIGNITWIWNGENYQETQIKPPAKKIKHTKKRLKGLRT